MEEQAQEEKPTQTSPASPGSSHENDKLYGVLAYIGILFLVPLLAAKDSKFAMYHANQGLVLFIFEVVVGVVGGILPFVGWFLIVPIGSLVGLIFAIMGIINAAKGEMKPLPLIGGIIIIK